MLSIDTSDCWLEIGVGKNFVRSLVWHFSRFLRENPPAFPGSNPLATETIDREARRLAGLFVADMQDYFRKNLAEAYEALENLSSEGIVELYLQENLEDFEADYLNSRAAGVRDVIGVPHIAVAPPEKSAVSPAALCH